MSASAQIRRMGTFTTLLLVLNLCLWIYFVISFATTSYPFERDPWGHPAGAGYTFLGHSIGVVESPFSHTFYRVMVWVEFPSFVLRVATDSCVIAVLLAVVLSRVGGSD